MSRPWIHYRRTAEVSSGSMDLYMRDYATDPPAREHLYRRHLLPIQCNRCCSTFANEPTLREHQRDPRGCEIKEQVPLEGFDKDQERKLKSKKRSLVYQSEEDKWKGVYRILFPDDNDVDMPSPYIEYQPCANGTPTGESPNIARFQEFSRLELPRLVRRTLEVTIEEEAQPLEERLKERLVDIVRDCQTQLITLFQSTMTRSANSSALSLSQLRIPETDNFVDPSTATRIVPVHGTQQRPGPAAPFHNFDSIQTSDTADYLAIPAQYPEHEPMVTKHEASPPVEGGGSTPDSGYDSTWNAAPLPPEHYIQDQDNFTQTLPFAPTPHVPQHQTQPAYNSGPMFVESDYVDLGGYYGLFQSRNAGFDAALMDPSWAYLDSTGSDGNGNGMGRGNGAVM
ncbi:hypothetical protein SLS60_007926 [Paraconiothyrium brasiliense]|uniref:C2H2-type domain-containing protein n=1 Tax=Paraconiothyrium brasiliense TaxID=300254 RepID=A0ABR3R3S1_9PLEO